MTPRAETVTHDKDANQARKVLTTKEAAVYMGIGVTTLQKLRHKKFIKVAKIGGRVLWPIKELDRYIELVTVEHGKKVRAQPGR